MLGHVPVATTVDMCTHVTGEMQTAAARIDHGLGNEAEAADPTGKPLMTGFQPVKGRLRSPEPPQIVRVRTGKPAHCA